MNIYEQKNTWKLLLLLTLLLIIIASILYTNYLSGKLANEERKKMELLADVYKQLAQATGNPDLGFMFSVIESNETVPLILADEKDNVLGFKNLDTNKIALDTLYLKRELQSMKAVREPIDIEYSKDAHQYIYYRDSYLLVQLRYFPFIQFTIILLFLAVAYLTFSTARRAEQNRVWAGMAKETAHQLGTPISALSGWVDYMKLQIDENHESYKVIPEVEKDIERLELIAERFSKIGSIPDLVSANLYDEVEKSTQYIRRRASGKVIIRLDAPQGKDVEAMISPPLFAWVIENLLKNALDAIGGSGEIDISVNKQGKQTFIDIKDSGKGIPPGKLKTVFQPGYSTKKRGWGLGLSLAKRIVEEFHNGKIFVKESQVGKGTTFRIVFKR
ncbi:MAG: HAMP domain-containing histidine kinase [Chitinophagales bacterium]|jgi:signal transduction histidine kinase|nr:HAMP domain-containing histidine kinase [Chitinophagales bacterium]